MEEGVGGEIVVGEAAAGEGDALAESGGAEDEIGGCEAGTAADVEGARAVEVAPGFPGGAGIAVVEETEREEILGAAGTAGWRE
jgi:hypothetical protein